MRLKFISIALFSAICFLSSLKFSTLVAQTDFDNFKTLISKGEIPADFSSLTYAKIKEDLANNRTELKGNAERIFLEGIHYSIDELLHSGLVIYGDEVTNYVTEIAKGLLKDDPALFNSLRFYTLKSNVTNAFSTDQGILFVTTGLISQITSEAQLALVIGHEISHYTKKHVVETFDWKRKNGRNSDKIQSLSQYSKDKEFEADKIGLELYHKAGYSKKEILPTFDVLMYSYLPFDEVPVPRDYWNLNEFVLPESYFPTESYPIKAIEDEDDSRSSHPNIRKRKEAMQEAMSAYGTWGNEVYKLTQERFIRIRNICRFESIRTDVIETNFADALYSIFILEKEYPNSIYLSRMKAKVWLGIAQHRNKNLLNKNLLKPAQLEGEIAVVHFLLKKFDRLEMSSYSMAQVNQIRTKYPKDKEINAIWERMISTLAITDKFDLSLFSSKSFQQSKLEFQQFNEDSTQVKKGGDDDKLSKYDKIKKKKNTDSPENFDENKFYTYALYNLINDDKFLKIYRKKKEIIDEEIQKDLALKELSRNEYNRAMKLEDNNRLRLGVKDVLFVEPLVYHYNKNEINRVKSQKLAENFADAIQKTSEDLNMTVTTLSSSTLKSFGTPGFNERAILLSYLSQLSDQDEIDVFPVDFDLLDEIKTNYGTSKVMFSMLEHSYSANIDAISVVYSLSIPPLALAIFPIKILTGHQTLLNVIVMDLDRGEISAGKKYYYNEPLTKMSMRAQVYNVLQQISTNPKPSKK
jgi:hypothetical protein